MRVNAERALFVLALVLVLYLPSISAWNCSYLQWTTPKEWFAGQQMTKTYSTAECSKLAIKTQLYRCQPTQPWAECENDTQCPRGALCGEGMVPRLCVACNTTSWRTNYEYVNVTTNVTAAMLDGRFWTTDTFYNHTGVDLIKTYELWSWSPSGNALSRDWVQHHRSTWGDSVDSDNFWSISERTLQFNATHVKFERILIRRIALDNGGGSMSSESKTVYYPSY